MSVLLQIHNLHKSFGQHPIFDGMSFTVGEKQKIAVIGRNGAGKSTLFRIIVGDEPADSGSIQIHDNTKIGYIRQQEIHFQPKETVLEFLLRTTDKEHWQCAKLASRFQLDNHLLNTPIAALSGGYQMRAKLVRMLLQDPNLLLLDEPTNYLDLSTLLLLEQFLQTYTGSVLLISHDRTFLEKTCHQTLEIDQGKATYHPQNITSYFAYKAQQQEQIKRYNKKVAKQQRHLQSFVDRFSAKASKASQAQSKLKQLQKLTLLEEAQSLQVSSIIIPTLPPKKGSALQLTDVSLGYPNHTVAEDVSFTIFRGEHVAIVGDNGQGKSTLLKTIQGALSPLAGDIRWAKDIRVGYYAQHVAKALPKEKTVEQYLIDIAPTEPEEVILRMAGNFLFSGHDIKKPISVLSGGEKARACLAGLLLQQHHVLLLDEPTNHLDIETVDALGQALTSCNTTVLFVSHNRQFLHLVADAIITVGNKKVKRYEHDYDNYLYHLEKQTAATIQEPPKNTAVKQIDPTEKKAQKEAEKARKKQQKDLELSLEKLEARKARLLKWFSNNPDTFSLKKTQQLQEVEKIIREKEEEWLDMVS